MLTVQERNFLKRKPLAASPAIKRSSVRQSILFENLFRKEFLVSI